MKGIDEIQWDLVDAVIISSYIYQKEIENELIAEKGFNGEIVRFYNEQDATQFFDLQNEYNFLTLERVETWEETAKRSESGYASEDIRIDFALFGSCIQYLEDYQILFRQ